MLLWNYKKDIKWILSRRANHNTYFGDFWRHGIKTWKHWPNRPFPSSFLPLFQNESKCETFHMKMSFTHKSIRMQIILIFIWKISHLDSVWNTGRRQLGNGPNFSSFNPFPSLPSVATDDRKQFQCREIVFNYKTGPLFLEFNWCKDTI